MPVFTWPADFGTVSTLRVQVNTVQCLRPAKHTTTCRYRDLSYSIWGPFGFYATIFFQQVASIGNNITVQLAASISAKVGL